MINPRQSHFDWLRLSLKAMTPRTLLYKILKEELQAKGYWRCQPQGNPSKGYEEQQKGMAKENSNG